MVPSHSVHTLVAGLANATGRAASAQELAAAMGCAQLALFVRDDEVGALVPAQGMPKTFSGGPLWRAFLDQCTTQGCYQTQVDLPASAMSLQQASAVSDGTAVVIVLGGPPDQATLSIVQAELPLLGALLRTEHALVISIAKVAEADAAASRAHTLARTLETARATASDLNRQLQQEQARKDEFLAMLAHELRNPLSPLFNSIEMLRRGDLPTEVASRLVAVMSRQLGQLIHLVDDLLDISRVSRGLITLRRASVSLADVLDDALDAIRPAVEARRHQLKTFGNHAPLYVFGDRVRLIQVFSNLLQNAVKYTDPGGIVELSVIPDGARVSVVVRDSGIGIPQEMLDRVFELFTQVTISRDRSQGGLGIGLTLVRQLVDLHGGHVTAHSEGVGCGSTFTVSLPLITSPIDIAPAKALSQ